MRLPQGSLAKTPRRRREPGRHIFAYCNVSTNQVLYSLTHALQGNKALRQLPDAGANNNPPKLRKDHWRPLWSVTLPDGKHGLAQGLHAFTKLREYRKMHELSWHPPPELARPTTQEEMDELQKELDERGGSKTETVHDLIKRNKKKMRQRMVMDQKANSIADLAAILIEQDLNGAKVSQEREQMSKRERREEIHEMLKLSSEASQGGLAKLDADIKALEQRRQAKKEGASDEAKSNRGLIRAIQAVEKQKRRMAFAAEAVAAAQEGRTLLSDDKQRRLESRQAAWQRMRSLREEIQGRRNAEPELAQDSQTAEEQHPAETAEAALVDAKSESSPDTASEATRPSKNYPRTAKQLALELEMVRRLHSRPERVIKALDAYTPRQSDIDELRGLAQYWTQLFPRIQRRYERSLANWKALQAAVDAGETQLLQFVDGVKVAPRKEGHEISYAISQQRSPARIARIQAMEAGMPFLKDISRIISEGGSIEEAEAKVEEHKTTQPDQQAEVTLTIYERGTKSQLKVMGPARAYATVLAKAKVEARAAELEQELQSAPATEGLAEEAAEDDEMLEDLDEVETQADDIAKITVGELIEATKQVRRLSTRVHDVEHIADFEAAFAQLADNKPLARELKPRWSELDLSEKRNNYEKLISEMKHQVLPLQQAKQLLASENGVDRLLKAADAARERSVVARRADNISEATQQRFAAKMFETVANLRLSEDVVLNAPEELLEEPVGVEEIADATAEDTVEAQTPDDAQQPDAQPTTSSEGGHTPLSDPTAPAIKYHKLLPSFPEKTTLPKKGATREKLIRLNRPIFAAAGVTVRWNNMLDAEYAEAWPEDVRHEPMGLHRHTAPKVDEEPVFDVAEFKNQPGGGYKGRRWERNTETERVRGVVGSVTESVLQAVKARKDARTSERREVRQKEREEKWKMEREERARLAEALASEQKAREEVGDVAEEAKSAEQKPTVEG